MLYHLTRKQNYFLYPEKEQAWHRTQFVGIVGNFHSVVSFILDHCEYCKSSYLCQWWKSIVLSLLCSVYSLRNHNIYSFPLFSQLTYKLIPSRSELCKTMQFDIQLWNCCCNFHLKYFLTIRIWTKLIWYIDI